MRKALIATGVILLFFTVASHAQVRSIDGSGNNLEYWDLGMADTPLLRVTTVEYENEKWTPAGADRPSSREVSNTVCAQTTSVPNFPFRASDFVWQWGQFLDHDIDLTENAFPFEPFNIPVPKGDPYFDPGDTGKKVIPLNRSAYEVDGDDVRQQINKITAWIDASNVYGSDQELADYLRTFSGGRLKTSSGDLLPLVDGFFLAGDVRANEQVGLTALHTLFVREHNHYADLYNAAGLDDEASYQQARIMVWAEIQAITYREFLPILLGKGAISGYQGYDPGVDPSIANFFSTASYRFGHSMLNATLLRLGPDLQPIAAGNLPLRDAFFAPQEILDHGIDSLLRAWLTSWHRPSTP
jgi:peroxidase